MRAKRSRWVLTEDIPCVILSIHPPIGWMDGWMDGWSVKFVRRDIEEKNCSPLACWYIGG